MEEEFRKLIEDFLNEFMQIEYKGKDHIVARKHYREVFSLIIPKYFQSRKNIHNIASTGNKGDKD